MNYTANIEVVLKGSKNNTLITSLVEQYLEKNKIKPNSVLTEFNGTDTVADCLRRDVRAVIIEKIPNFIEEVIDLSKVKINWYVYTLDSYGPAIQSEDLEGEEEINIATHLTLPSETVFNLWENLFYEDDIKENLLYYAHSMMEFSDKGVDPNVVSCNRVILLHGPPGTGKTSLCKALAQKLTVRMQDRYSSGILIEINSHSLFSKWFSESGKLVNKMFSKIQEIVENSDILVCVLIDEVESLAHARSQCTSGAEPSDSIRVVNAVLTQIDQIKRFPNVLIFATSNMTEAIDLAFIDRADIKQFLGLPSIPAIYRIYYSCLQELMKTEIIKNDKLPSSLKESKEEQDEDLQTSKSLLKVCEKSIGLSGRALRKMPFIAHSLFLHNKYSQLPEFLEALEKAVDREHYERKFFDSKFKKEIVSSN